MKLLLTKATTSQLVHVFIQDSSATTGAGLTGLTSGSAGLTAYYYREGAGTGATAITLAATGALGTWESGGFFEIDATDMPGWYELGLPDAVLATGVDFVGVQLKGATNMAQTNLEIQLTNVDVNDGVRGGMTALPNAAADAAGGLPISDAGGLDLDTILDVAVSTRLAPTDAGRTLDINIGGNAGIDWSNIALAATVQNLSNTTVNLCNTTTTNTDMRGTDSAALASVATEARLAELDAANLPADVDTLLTRGGTPTDGGGGATIADNLADLLYTTAGVRTTIATLASQTSFTLTAGSADDDAYNGWVIVVRDAVTANQIAVGVVDDYTGASKTVTLLEDPAVFTMAVGDAVELHPSRALKSSVQNRNVVIDANGRIDVGAWLGTAVTTSATSAKPEVDVNSISDDATAANNLEEAMTGVVTGAAEAGTLSTTQMSTDLAETTNDHYIGRIVTWLTGVLAGQSSDITDYVGVNGVLTFTAVTEAPGAGDTFVIT